MIYSMDQISRKLAGLPEEEKPTDDTSENVETYADYYDEFEEDEDYGRSDDEGEIFIPYSSPVDIKRKLDEVIVGQEETKRVLAMAMYRHMVEYSKNLNGTPKVILLMGPSGSGKTLSAKTIASIMGLPYVVFEAGQITNDGWRGLDKSKMLEELDNKN